jgi:hypothetical protein
MIKHMLVDFNVFKSQLAAMKYEWPTMSQGDRLVNIYVDSVGG